MSPPLPGPSSALFLSFLVLLFIYCFAPPPPPPAHARPQVRNSWSKFYGEDGYIKIKRGKDDCGIATEANVAVVADEFVVPGQAAKAAKLAVSMCGHGGVWGVGCGVCIWSV